MTRLSNILCVVEGVPTDRNVLQRGVLLAESHQADLSVVHVIEKGHEVARLPEGSPSYSELRARLKAEALQKLDKLVEPFSTRVSISTRVLSGTLFLEVIREAIRGGHDLVIKSPESPEWVHHLFSSDDMHLLRKCPCPVWLAREGAPHPYKCILAAVDLYDDEAYSTEELQTKQALNKQILDMACSLAVADSAELHIAHAWEAIGEDIMRSAFASVPEKTVKAYVDEVSRQKRADLSQLLDELRHDLGAKTLDYLKPQTHLVKGWARKVIPEVVQKIDADLVVMGTIGRTGVPGYFMGNTAEAILNQMNCSVLAMKPPGFRTPVKLES